MILAGAKKDPLPDDQNHFMLPTKMPMDETTNDGCPPNHHNGIEMPDAVDCGRYPLAPTLRKHPTTNTKAFFFYD